MPPCHDVLLRVVEGSAAEILWREIHRQKENEAFNATLISGTASFVVAAPKEFMGIQSCERKYWVHVQQDCPDRIPGESPVVNRSGDG
jgi:hypothetical protein